jgi:hypothetical protein
VRFYSALLLSILLASHIYAQKISIEKLSKQKIDSLRSKHVDTMLWYHSYCGECEVFNKEIKYANCNVFSGYTLTYNSILYKQMSKYFILNFDCNNLVMKRQLDTCKSIPYFISIIPILNARDKTLKVMHKNGEFFPWQVDGGFEDADIYINKTTQHISMSDMEETNKVFKKYIWIGKQIKLLKLVSGDIAVKKH